MQDRTVSVSRDGDIKIDGKLVASVIREPSVAPPNWMVVCGEDGRVASWHYLRRDAVEDVKRRFARG